MRLLPWEEDRILIFSAAELARRTRAAGLRLSHPEAVAIICDAMLTVARGGGSYEDVVAAGRGALREDDVIDGVRALLDEVRLEVVLDDGTRLVVLVDPLGPVDPLFPEVGAHADLAAAPPAVAASAVGRTVEGGTASPGSGTSSRTRRASGARPGEVRVADEDVDLAVGRDRIRLRVENSSSRVARVSSHYPFERTNQRLLFDRKAAAGFRLDIPAGGSVRWAPGEVHEVELVRYAGRIGGSSRARAGAETPRAHPSEGGDARGRDGA